MYVVDFFVVGLTRMSERRLPKSSIRKSESNGSTKTSRRLSGMMIASMELVIEDVSTVEHERY